MAIDAAGYFVLLLMFGPKVYIIFLEPQKNTPIYVSKMNMIHIWKQHSKQEMKERRKIERLKAEETSSSTSSLQTFGKGTKMGYTVGRQMSTDGSKTDPKLLSVTEITDSF